MEAKTVDLKYNIGRVVPVRCIENDTLRDLNIQNNCFLLLIVHEGSVSLQCGEEVVDAMGPCLLCFDERRPLRLLRRRNLCCDAIYFHPTFLNVNMTFERVRSGGYEELATIHDLFLLGPFVTNRRPILPMIDDYQASMRFLFSKLSEEIEEQSDWYWSCRGRSYFMELLIALERSYAEVGYGHLANEPYGETAAEGKLLQDAILYLEGCFSEDLDLERVCNYLGVSRSALTAAFRKGMNTTVMEYLMSFRVRVAKKHLAFTEIPQKEIALRCGFKTVPHFSRVFKQHTGQTPGEFRKNAVQRRKDEIK